MYLYSNCVGTFVFNQNFHIREKVYFSKQESLKNSRLIEKGKILDSEKKFLDKFKNIENLRKTKDKNKLARVLPKFRKFHKKFYEKNIFITKNKIRESVTKDLLIIQTISSIEEYNKVINMLVKRLREWYAYYFPEIEEKTEDNEKFVDIILKKSKSNLKKELNVGFSMGKDIEQKDLDAIFELGGQISSLYSSKNKQEIYLEKLMLERCPNLDAVAGTTIGAKLISLAGSLRRLVMFPASTVQLLGAEKALFRHMRNKKRYLPPKHGVIVQHPLIQQNKKSLSGKIARTLADKIALAVKIDYFKGDFKGKELRKEVEDKIKEMK
ncbi:hypothetical protein GF327_00350 [Candidatus Woesearchaeota archaeon]|nr:hypothetical protein [Candidatus Woesearchaeota archaeon]